MWVHKTQTIISWKILSGTCLLEQVPALPEQKTNTVSATYRNLKVIHERDDITAVSGFINSAMKMLMQNNSWFASSSFPLTVVSGSSVQLSWSTFLTYCCLAVRTPTNCANGKPAVLLTPSSESSGWAPPLRSCWGRARSSRSSPCASCCACCRRRG